MEREILKEMHERMVKGFLDAIVLAKLSRERDNPISGYDVITLIHKKFYMLVSSGTVYALLYAMERDGLIRGRWSQGKRVYALTEKGEEKIKVILEVKEKILGLMVNLFI